MCAAQGGELIERVQLGGSSVKEVSSSSREGARPNRTVTSNNKTQKRHYNKAVTIWVSPLPECMYGQSFPQVVCFASQLGGGWFTIDGCSSSLTDWWVLIDSFLACADTSIKGPGTLVCLSNAGRRQTRGDMLCPGKG